MTVVRGRSQTPETDATGIVQDKPELTTVKILMDVKCRRNPIDMPEEDGATVKVIQIIPPSYEAHSLQAPRIRVDYYNDKVKTVYYEDFLSRFTDINGKMLKYDKHQLTFRKIPRRAASNFPRTASANGSAEKTKVGRQKRGRARQRSTSADRQDSPDHVAPVILQSRPKAKPFFRTHTGRLGTPLKGTAQRASSAPAVTLVPSWVHDSAKADQSTCGTGAGNCLLYTSPSPRDRG